MATSGSCRHGVPSVVTTASESAISPKANWPTVDPSTIPEPA